MAYQSGKWINTRVIEITFKYVEAMIVGTVTTNETGHGENISIEFSSINKASKNIPLDSMPPTTRGVEPTLVDIQYQRRLGTSYSCCTELYCMR